MNLASKPANEEGVDLEALHERVVNAMWQAKTDRRWTEARFWYEWWTFQFFFLAAQDDAAAERLAAQWLLMAEGRMQQ